MLKNIRHVHALSCSQYLARRFPTQDKSERRDADIGIFAERSCPASDHASVRADCHGGQSTIDRDEHVISPSDRGAIVIRGDCECASNEFAID